MTKAKEYAERYLDSFKSGSQVEALRDILSDLAGEVKEIATQRHVRTNESLVTILKEQENKWKAIVRIVNNDPTAAKDQLKLSGFRSIIRHTCEDTYDLWLTYERNLAQKQKLSVTHRAEATQAGGFKHIKEEMRKAKKTKYKERNDKRKRSSTRIDRKKAG